MAFSGPECSATTGARRQVHSDPDRGIWQEPMRGVGRLVWAEWMDGSLRTFPGTIAIFLHMTG